MIEVQCLTMKDHEGKLKHKSLFSVDVNVLFLLPINPITQLTKYETQIPISMLHSDAFLHA